MYRYQQEAAGRANGRRAKNSKEGRKDRIKDEREKGCGRPSQWSTAGKHCNHRRAGCGAANAIAYAIASARKQNGPLLSCRRGSRWRMTLLDSEAEEND